MRGKMHNMMRRGARENALKPKRFSSSHIAWDRSPIDPAPLAPSIKGSGYWGCVYTAPREEERAIQSLTDQGYAAWSPMLTLWVKSGMRRARAHRPLFSRYVFVGIVPGIKKPIMDCDRVQAIVCQGSEREHVPFEIIADLSERQDRGAFDLTASMKDTNTYQEGEAVEFAEGPLQGLTAKVIAAPSDERITVLMTILGASREVRTTAEHLAKAG